MLVCKGERAAVNDVRYGVGGCDLEGVGGDVVSDLHRLSVQLDVAGSSRNEAFVETAVKLVLVHRRIGGVGSSQLDDVTRGLARREHDDAPCIDYKGPIHQRRAELQIEGKRAFTVLAEALIGPRGAHIRLENKRSSGANCYLSAGREFKFTSLRRRDDLHLHGVGRRCRDHDVRSDYACGDILRHDKSASGNVEVASRPFAPRRRSVSRRCSRRVQCPVGVC